MVTIISQEEGKKNYLVLGFYRTTQRFEQLANDFLFAQVTKPAHHHEELDEAGLVVRSTLFLISSLVTALANLVTPNTFLEAVFPSLPRVLTFPNDPKMEATHRRRKKI